MADTTADTGLMPRTYFRAPRVPLDLRALTIAVLGVAVFAFGSWLLDQIFTRSPVGVFFTEVLKVIGGLPYVGEEIQKFFASLLFVGGGARETGGFAAGTFWEALVGGTWFFVVWAFFGQAIHRITALRIARDEGLSLKEAFQFSIKNFTTIVYCPLIVAGAIALFYGCNALAGVVIAIPVAGEILSLVLVPLALISTLLILLIAIGGVIGMPLVGAAAAWERNGSLDAISRAFSYIFARPLQFFWYYFLIFLFTSILLLAGARFWEILWKSVDSGMWRWGALTNTGSLSEVGHAGITDIVTAFVFWAVGHALNYVVVGVVLWWFFGATTSTYADLRADVDGTEEDEIYLEEEEQDFEALAKPPEAPAPAAGTPAPGTPPPASPPPAAPTA
jgi:hypothetical protein